MEKLMSIKDMVKIANKLDSVGLTKEADLIDSIILKSSMKRDYDVDVEDISFDDELGNTETRHAESPEQVLLNMIFAVPAIKAIGRNPEEVAKALGLDPEDKKVIRLLEQILTPHASIFSSF